MKERRISNHTPLTVFRGAEGEASRTVRGYAVVFNSESVDLGGFTEIIEPNALDGVVEQSDVMAVLNHDINRGLLARSRKGEGSLSLEVDDKGLRYEFEAPKTALGDELLESIKRGDIDKSSFCFTVADDTWEKRSDGSVLRTIKKIDRLFDISPVYSPAYEATEVIADARGLENLNNNTDTIMNKDKRSKAEAIEKLKAILAELQDEEPQEAPQDDEEQKAQPDEDENGKGEEAPQPNEDEKPDEDEAPKDEEAPQDDEEEPAQEDEKPKDEAEEKGCGEGDEKEKKSTNVRMNKKFSLIQTINDVVNNRQLNEAAQAVVKEGRSQAAQAGINAEGQIVLPLETRAPGDPAPAGIFAQVVTQGNEVVPTDTFDLVGALRDKLVLSQLGATMLSLQGNVEIPIYSGASCYWESECGEAQNGAGTFKSVKLSPKRITATLPISKMFLAQTSASVEALIRQDLVNVIAEKLQQTILGDEAGDITKPKGMFYGVTADSSAIAYKDLVKMEADLESANIGGEYKFVLNPLTKAALRTCALDAGSGRFAYDENHEVLGIPTATTNSVVSKGMIIGDWKELIIGSFSAIDLVVDPYTAANKGQILLHVNAYFDYVERRPEAFVKKIIK